MSIFFHHIIAQNGTLALNVGSGAIVGGIGSQGLILDDTGAIYASTELPAYQRYGLPYDADDRLCVEVAAPDFFSQGLPFTFNGALAVSTDDSALDYSQGLAFDAAGSLYVTGNFTPTASYFGIANFTGTPREVFWDLSTTPWTLASPITESYTEGTLGLASGDGLAVTGSSGSEPIKFWDTSTFPFTKYPALAFPTSGQVNFIVSSPAGNIFATCHSSTNGNYLLDLSDPNSPSVGSAFLNAQLNGATFNSDGTILATTATNDSPATRFWDTSTITPTEITPQLSNQPTTFGQGVDFYPPDENIVVAGFSGNQVLAFDYAGDSVIATIHSQSAVGLIGFNPEGSRLCIAYIGGFWMYDTSDTDPNNWTQGAQVAIGGSTAIKFRFWIDNTLCVLTDDSNDVVLIYDGSDINAPVDVTTTYITDQSSISSPNQPALIF